MAAIVNTLFKTNRRVEALSCSVAVASISAVLLAPHLALAQTYTLTTLATFNGANGGYSKSDLILDSSGNLYGTAVYGGAIGGGTVFEIGSGTNNVNTLASFSGTNGAEPAAGLTLDRSGNLFGTTQFGGANSDGTVFEISAGGGGVGTGALTTLASFSGPDGLQPVGDLILDSSGNLYGTTSGGGANGDGTVFEIEAGSGGVGTGAFTTLASFNGTNGANPNAGLTLDSKGNLYGTTVGGGASSDGTVFEIAAGIGGIGTGALTTLAVFNGTNGSSPIANVTLDSSGNLYGTTGAGGASGDGTVFRITAGTNALTTLVAFDGTNGDDPTGLTLDGNGNLYGTTAIGGDLSLNGGNGLGVVYEIAAGVGGIGTGGLTSLATFSDTKGGAPAAGLTLDPNGNLYGTTQSGGANEFGTVFELSLVGSASAPEPGALALLLPTLAPLGLAIRRRNTLKGQFFAGAFQAPASMNALVSLDPACYSTVWIRFFCRFGHSFGYGGHCKMLQAPQIRHQG